MLSPRGSCPRVFPRQSRKATEYQNDQFAPRIVTASRKLFSLGTYEGIGLDSSCSSEGFPMTAADGFVRSTLPSDFFRGTLLRSAGPPHRVPAMRRLVGRVASGLPSVHERLRPRSACPCRWTRSESGSRSFNSPPFDERCPFLQGYRFARFRVTSGVLRTQLTKRAPPWRARRPCNSLQATLSSRFQQEWVEETSTMSITNTLGGCARKIGWSGTPCPPCQTMWC